MHKLPFSLDNPDGRLPQRHQDTKRVRRAGSRRLLAPWRLYVGLLSLLSILLFSGCTSQVNSGTLTGTVKTEAGAPVAGATVGTIPATAPVTTDSVGAFVLDFVPGGTYLVKAGCSGLLPDSAQCIVATGDTAVVNLTLRMARRMVSAEMISTVCECSRVERGAMYALMDSLGDSIVFVEYHATSDTLAEHWEPLLSRASELRRLQYCPDFTLGGWLYLDGLTEQKTTGFYHQLLDSLARVPSPVAVSLTATRVGDSAVTATLDLTAVESFGPNVGLGIGLFELGPIPYVAGPDTFQFRNVVLDLKFTDTLGLAAGESRTLQRTIAIPDTLSPLYPPVHLVDKNNIGMYVIIQDLATRQVLQAARLRL